MKMKGISPLVAAVLLIAVTMTIAGVLAYWGSTFIRTQTDTFSNQTVTTECNFGNFVIDACSYDSGAQRVTFIVDNVGNLALRNLSATIIYPDLSLNQTSLFGDVPSGTLRSFQVNGVVPGFDTVRVGTQCANIREETTCR